MARFSPREKGRNPLIAVVGPTASGKSDLGVQLARKFGGEVVSADSRQVYKGLDIGSGKITKKEMRGIPHHLLDVASPKRKFTVVQYQRRANQAIASIHRRDTLPILLGGTPFYVYALIDNYVFPEVKPDLKLRAELNKLSADQLLTKLKKLDPERAKIIEQKNKRRLIRALEIVVATGKPVPKLGQDRSSPALMIGMKKSPEELKQRIHKRLLKRLKQGMIQEVEYLHSAGLSWNRLEELGLEYRFVAQYLQKKISKQEMLDAIQKESEDFARRQMVWFKKDSRIHWIENQAQAEQVVNNFLA
jgi:tRNA dimethylallyltransferase